MVEILKNLQKYFTKVKSISPGMYHFQSPVDDPNNYRLHLRIEPDGEGILVINAATVLHLNQTAAEFAYYRIQNMPREEAIAQIIKRYRINFEQASKDYSNFLERIHSVITTPDLDPVTFLDFERQLPYSGKISAPYRLDCAITYKVPENTNPDVAPFQRVKREMSTQEWNRIMDIAWQAGIPHILFTGGEPTLREDLPDLISHAESNGQVSGLLTDGLKLADSAFLHNLLQTGLDHIMIVLQPNNELSWHVIEQVAKQDIFTAVHLTITEPIQGQAPEYIKRAASCGINAMSLTTQSQNLSTILKSCQDLLSSLNIPLVWDLPVPYSSDHPLSMEVNSDELIDGSGRAWIYVEPDGDVLPAQGINQVLGNILTDPWDSIWANRQ
jgi:hypothetical protein